MAIYTGIDCPVCGEKFKDGEDIVTCPICGTPSHRACYEKNGKCINYGKHSDGFEFKIKKQEDNDETNKPPLPPLEKHEESPQKVGVAVPAIDTANVNVGDIRIEQGDTLGGESPESMSNIVKKKTHFYIEKFRKLEKKKSKISWNLAAIVFGPYWFFYRRMSKIGAFILALEVIANAFITVMFRESFVKMSSVMLDVSSQMAESGSVATQAMLDKVLEVAKGTQIVPALLINLAIIAVIRIVSGLIANNFYKEHCIRLVKLAKENVETPELAVKLQSIGYAVKSKKDILNIYLSQLGGTSFLGVLTGYLGYMLMTQLVATFL